MFKKLIQISNYGKFKDFNISSSDWDGTFKKNNIIYAPNGSGKTSLSLLFNSIKGDDSVVLKKQTFDSENKPFVKFILNNNKELKFNSCWNKKITKIEVFDSFYFEENLYSISINDDLLEANIFELSIKDEINKIKQEIICLKDQKEKLTKKISNRKNYIRKNNSSHKDDRTILDLTNQRKEIENKIKALHDERIQRTEEQRNKYVDSINKYLDLFCDTMHLSEIKLVHNSKANIQSLIYGLEIDGHNITIKDRSTTSLKYYLSDGDKNALSLSFFLARMDMLPELNSYSIVIDDPFTSFDSQRKMTTITQLVKLSNKVEQFFLLTHDLHFANDFNKALSIEALNLKIQNYKNSSFLFLHDPHRETLTGFNKDLQTLRNFVTDPSQEDSVYLREVIRCIRPTIEGIFRIKYFNYIKDNQWLGDFIKMIKEADTSSAFYKLKDYLEEIEEINEYSKIYHHSNPNYIEVGISTLELKNYVKRTLKLLENI